MSEKITYDDKVAMVTDYFSKFPPKVQREIFENVPDDTITKQVDYLFDQMLRSIQERNSG